MSRKLLTHHLRYGDTRVGRRFFDPPPRYISEEEMKGSNMGWAVTFTHGPEREVQTNRCPQAKSGEEAFEMVRVLYPDAQLVKFRPITRERP